MLENGNEDRSESGSESEQEEFSSDEAPDDEFGDGSEASVSDDDSENEDNSDNSSSEGEESSPESEEEADLDVDVKDKKVESWSKALSRSPSAKVVLEIMTAFHATIQALDDIAISKLKQSEVEETIQRFDSMIKISMANLPSALSALLKVDPTAKKKGNPRKSSHWPTLSKGLKTNINDLSSLLTSLSDPSTLSALLKHVNEMTAFIYPLEKQCEKLLNTVTKLWTSSPTDSIVALASSTIIQMVKYSDSNTMKEATLGKVLTAYSNMSKANAKTLPMLEIRRMTATGLLALQEPDQIYQHTYKTIKELTTTVNEVMDLQSASVDPNPMDVVFAWSFLNRITLLTNILADPVIMNRADLEQLLFPFVQLVEGILKLGKGQTMYSPMKLHLLTCLLKLSIETKKFIPILPHYLAMLESPALLYNAKNKTVSPKEQDFSAHITLSKEQIADGGCKDYIIDQIFKGLLDCLEHYSNKISFPELALPVCDQLKTYVGNCKAHQYAKKFKTIMERTSEHSNFLLAKRKKVNFGVQELEKIKIWEAQMKQKASPFSKWAESTRNSQPQSNGNGIKRKANKKKQRKAKKQKTQ